MRAQCVNAQQIGSVAGTGERGGAKKRTQGRRNLTGRGIE